MTEHLISIKDEDIALRVFRGGLGCLLDNIVNHCVSDPRLISLQVNHLPNTTTGPAQHYAEDLHCCYYSLLQSTVQENVACRHAELR